MFIYDSMSFAGVEYMARNVNSKILPSLEKFNNYNCLLCENPEYLSGKDFILWLHNNLCDYSKYFPAFLQENSHRIKKIICVSEWHKNKFLSEIQADIDETKITYIYNAVDDIEYDLKRFKKNETIKIIQTTKAYRGLNILLHSLKNINKNIEVYIFNDLYTDLLNDKEKKYIQELVGNKKVYFFGQTPIKTVHKFISESHIFAYPASVEETFCIAQAEAMSAGCLSVTSNLGALKETSGGYSLTFDFDDNDFEKNVKNYSLLLNNAIDLIENQQWNPQDQCNFIKNNYSWNKIYQDWEKLHQEI